MKSKYKRKKKVLQKYLEKLDKMTKKERDNFNFSGLKKVEFENEFLKNYNIVENEFPYNLNIKTGQIVNKHYLLIPEEKFSDFEIHIFKTMFDDFFLNQTELKSIKKTHWHIINYKKNYENKTKRNKKSIWYSDIR